MVRFLQILLLVRPSAACLRRFRQGIHDMGWKERDVFGKIRFMNYAGCKRKFKVDTFVARYKGAKENANKVAPAAGDKKVAGKKRKSKSS